MFTSPMAPHGCGARCRAAVCCHKGIRGDGIPSAPSLRGQRSSPCSPGWSSRSRGGSGAPQGCAWARRQEETTDFLRSAGKAARPRGLWFVHLQAAAPEPPAGNNGPSVTCRESGMCLSLWAACLLLGRDMSQLRVWLVRGTHHGALQGGTNEPALVEWSSSPGQGPFPAAAPSKAGSEAGAGAVSFPS